jgi:pimeloyl-ACP methyl ester carboxylesterase
MAARPQHYDLAGGRIESAWFGPAPSEMPTLVLLHEGLGCVAMWRDFPERLAERTGWGVFAYSRYGYGGSAPCALPRPTSYMHDEALTVLPELLSVAGVGAHALVGHSDGGSIALIHAGGAARDCLRGVAVLAPHVFVEDVSVQSIARAGTQFLGSDLPTRLGRYHGVNLDCAFWGWQRAWVSAEFRGWNIEDSLPRIRVPVLAIQGEDDEYGTMRQVQAIAALSGGPVELAKLARCGHSPQRDQPETVLDRLARFVAALPPIR